MTGRILLVSLNTCAVPESVFPLGLSMLSAALREAGHQTEWYDCLADQKPLAEVLTRFQPRVVGISIRNIDDVLIKRRETFFDRVSEVCETIRRLRPCPIVVGGSGFSIFPERLLELSQADFGVQGEGEATFLALIQALLQGAEYFHLPGLVYRRDGRTIVNPPMPATDSIAVQAEDRPERLVDFYLGRAGMLNVQTQRGCAHRCCYCTYPVVEGRGHRRRSADLVAEEMARIEAQGAKYVFVVDSVFNSSTRHSEEICRALQQRKLKLRWGCFLRPQGLTRELMELMREAGLAHIEFGSDSFCDDVLRAYGKGLRFEDILHASELAQAAEIDFCHFLILGGPGETLQTLECTFRNSLRVASAPVLAVVGMRIYPGTPLFGRAVEEGVIDATTDLLSPKYYLAPGLMTEEVFAAAESFARQAPHWIVGDSTPAYQSLVDRLRQRGVAGPLWSYFSMARRLWPEGFAKRSPIA